MDNNLETKRTGSAGTSKIVEKSQEAAEQLKDAVVDQANLVRDKAESAKQHTTDRIRGVATQLQNASDSLRADDPLAANLAERASRGAEDIARYVSSASVQSVVRDTERLARRQPALFFGGAFLLGLAAGRFLRSSPPNDDGATPALGYGDKAGGPLVTRQDRSSGFFPTAERGLPSNRRYQENDAAKFNGDVALRPSRTESAGPGQTSGKGNGA
jgi:hypothetical protein